MRKVVIVMPHLWTGGIQKINLEIAAHIKGVEVTILSLYPRSGSMFEKWADDHGVKVVYLDKKPGLDLSIVPKISGFLKRYKPDVVHINQRMTTYTILPILMNGIKKRMYVVHNMADRDAHGIVRMVNRFAFHFLKVVPVAISDICRHSISEVYGIKESEIPCIYNGVDTNEFKREKPYEPNDECVFIDICAFWKDKNIPLLVRAFAKVHSENKNTKLIVVGDGETRPEIEKAIKEHNLEGAVELPGFSEDIKGYLEKSDVFTMSSNVEGLPISILEAMSMGLPIISTRVGGIADIVEDNGYLVDKGDAYALADIMLSAANNKKLRKELSDSSLRLAEKYSIEKCAENYANLYNAI